MNSKAWFKKYTSKKFRQLMKQSTLLEKKISGRRIGRAYWGSGMGKGDLPKEEE